MSKTKLDIAVVGFAMLCSALALGSGIALSNKTPACNPDVAKCYYDRLPQN